MNESLVQLYCYDISNGMAANMSLLLIGQQLEGIWHTSIVVYGKEFYFDGGIGIVYESPGKTRFGQPKRLEVIGTTHKTEADFLVWVQQKRRSAFGPNDYNLLSRNCNHFTQEAAQFLVSRDIPDDIRNMIPLVLETPLGRMIRPMLETITTAPIGGNSTSQSIQEKNLPVDVAKNGLYSTKNQLTEDEEENLMIALAMLQSNELFFSKSQEGFDITYGALVLLCSVLENILEHPAESKYRGLSTNSQAYKKKLLPLEQFGVVEILRLSGFRLRGHPSGTGQQWYLSDTEGNENILKSMVAHVKKTIDAVKEEASKFAPSAITNNNCNEMSSDTKASLKDTELERSKSGQHLLEEILRDAGKPFISLEELLEWSTSTGDCITPAVPCRLRTTDTSEQRPRLLVCHDMCGGYAPGDYSYFGISDPFSSVKPVVDMSYTVNYWHLVDYFVYFAHHRVSIPPKEWINAAHREGVPVLGTFITEHDKLDILLMLQSAKKMSHVIERLVRVCNAYNFDGYLINVESAVDEVLAKRLMTFVTLLRQTLNKRRPPSSIERKVIWYDAVTITGEVHYQNALTVKNKPFFDAGSGLFTNYSWRPVQLNLSELLAGDRARDVYVGIDVFGRSGMYGGGGFNSKVAAECIAATKLSTALFAPAWTLEEKGNRQRETFLHSDARLWSGLQNFFNVKHVEYDTLPVWTSFRSGVGKVFYVNGTCVVGEGCYSAEWCQLSQSHFTPCYQFLHGSAAKGIWCTLPLEEERDGAGGERRGELPVEWTTNVVWMGDRSLHFVVPCRAAVTLLQWKVKLDMRTNSNGVLAFLDIVWWRDPSSKSHSHSRRVRIDGISEASATQFVFDEEDTSNGLTRVVACLNDWEIIRYTIPAETNWSHVISVSVLNVSQHHAMPCTVGGIGFDSYHHHHHHHHENKRPFDDTRGNKDSSILLAGPAQELPEGTVAVMSTREPTTRVIKVKRPHEVERHQNVLVFATVSVGNDVSVCMYMGQHEFKSKIMLPLHIAPNAVVEKLIVHDVSIGS